MGAVHYLSVGCNDQKELLAAIEGLYVLAKDKKIKGLVIGLMMLDNSIKYETYGQLKRQPLIASGLANHIALAHP